MDKTIRLTVTLVWLTLLTGGLVFTAMTWRDNDREHQLNTRIAEHSQCIKQFSSTYSTQASPEFNFARDDLEAKRVAECIVKYPIYQKY